jgi:hypothetical protein
MTTPGPDYTGQLLSYLQAWRQFLEQPGNAMPRQSWPASQWPLPSMAVSPPTPPHPAPQAPGPASTTARPGTAPQAAESIQPGAAPPGPRVPPVAAAPTADTAGTAAQPAYPYWAPPDGGTVSRAVHPGVGSGRQERPGPGQTAAFSAGLTAPPANSVPGRVPRSAYSWTEQPLSTEAVAELPAAVSLFAEPSAAQPQERLEGLELVTPEESIEGVPTLPPGPLFGQPQSRPPETAFGLTAPINPDATYVPIPPGRGQLPWLARSEIVGGDPRI